jgi:hypothetical protein
MAADEIGMALERICDAYETALAEARRRDKLEIAQPDWSTAPKLANWWAVDANGSASWYEFEPTLYETATFCGWSRPTIRGFRFGETRDDAHIEIPLGVDWRTLKYKREEREVER